MRLAFVFVLSAALFGCASVKDKPATFHVEPNNRVTFSPGQSLPSGAVLKLQFDHLASQEVFLINRCGEPCNTSKVVSYVSGAQPSSEDVTFQVEEAGSYYLWMQKQLTSGEVGPVFIDKFRGDASSFYAMFKSGTVVTGKLILPSH